MAEPRLPVGAAFWRICIPNLRHLSGRCKTNSRERTKVRLPRIVHAFAGSTSRRSHTGSAGVGESEGSCPPDRQRSEGEVSVLRFRRRGEKTLWRLAELAICTKLACEPALQQQRPKVLQRQAPLWLADARLVQAGELRCAIHVSTPAVRLRDVGVCVSVARRPRGLRLASGRLLANIALSSRYPVQSGKSCLAFTSCAWGLCAAIGVGLRVERRGVIIRGDGPTIACAARGTRAEHKSRRARAGAQPLAATASQAPPGRWLRSALQNSLGVNGATDRGRACESHKARGRRERILEGPCGAGRAERA